MLGGQSSCLVWLLTKRVIELYTLVLKQRYQEGAGNETPDMGPKATHPAGVTERRVNQLHDNQNPSTQTARMRTSCDQNPSGISTSTRAWGNSSR